MLIAALLPIINLIHFVVTPHNTYFVSSHDNCIQYMTIEKIDDMIKWSFLGFPDEIGIADYTMTCAE